MIWLAVIVATIVAALHLYGLAKDPSAQGNAKMTLGLAAILYIFFLLVLIFWGVFGFDP